LKRACDAALDLLYPRFCMACGCCLSGTDSDYVCPACWDAIPLIAEPSCGKCGSFLGKFAKEMNSCEDCRRHDLRFKRAVCAAKYDEPLRSLILKLKFGSEMLLAEPLSRLLIARLAGHAIMGKVDVIVPVPLHRNREKTRGFNQAELIAKRRRRRDCPNRKD
jgi:predicted amidophosphoribosyltransferase